MSTVPPPSETACRGHIDLEELLGIEPRTFGLQPNVLPLDHSSENWCPRRESNPHEIALTDPSSQRVYRFTTRAYMAALMGLEPTTFRLTTGCSNQLSYSAMYGTEDGSRTHTSTRDTGI